MFCRSDALRHAVRLPHVLTSELEATEGLVVRSLRRHGYDGAIARMDRRRHEQCI